MSKNVFEYFVSFYFEDKNCKTGYSCATFTHDKEINSSKEIDEIIDIIKADDRFKNVVIINFQLLNKKKGNEKK